MRRMLMIVGLLATSSAWSHGGGLDRNGCHHDRKNGGYHCHRGAPNAASRPDAVAPARSLQPGSNAGAFANCAQARAAGAAPVRRGDPGYSRKLDRDGDGIGCE